MYSSLSFLAPTSRKTSHHLQVSESTSSLPGFQDNLTTLTNLPQKVTSYDPLASFMDFVSYWIILVIVCVGIVTNTLNLVVFARQGYKDGVNISMTCIALWDFLKCFAGIVDRIHKPIGLISPALGLSYKNAVFMFLGYTHVFTGYVSCALAAYVSIERCLCVRMPFTVKSVFTPKFTLLMVTAISVIVFGAYVVMYFIWDIVEIYNPKFDTMISEYHYNDFYYANREVVMLYYQVVAILLPASCFLVLCVCSAVTVHCLRQSSKFLHGVDMATSESKDGESRVVTQREKQVVKMLVVVIAVYIGNLFPRILYYVAQLIEPEFYINRRYHRHFKHIGTFLFILDDINAAVNFFIFVKMSSNFKSTFLALLPCARQFL